MKKLLLILLSVGFIGSLMAAAPADQHPRNHRPIHHHHHHRHHHVVHHPVRH